MVKKKSTLTSIIDEVTSSKKKKSTKKNSTRKSRSDVAKDIQDKAKDVLLDTITKRPRSKKARKYQLILILILLVVIVVSGYFTYQEVAPFSPVNHYEPTELSAYYEGAAGLEGNDLRTFLSNRVSQDYVGVNYGVARQALAKADVDPNNPNNVLTIYTRESVKGLWDGTTWTREHVWPNSRLGVPRVTNTQINQASDLHNLRAIIQSVNSSRSNKVYDATTTDSTYYPGDDRGDVARILFYMILKYPILSLTDEILPNDPDTNYTLEGAKMSRISVLLQWHFDDPVDQFELDRNEVIYTYQNNRNPFIDHPEFVAEIFNIEQDVYHSSESGYKTQLSVQFTIIEATFNSKKYY